MTCHWARLFTFELIYEIQLNILWQLLIYLFQIADKEMNQIRQNSLLKSQVYNGFIWFLLLAWSEHTLYHCLQASSKASLNILNKQNYIYS